MTAAQLEWRVAKEGYYLHVPAPVGRDIAISSDSATASAQSATDQWT